MFILFDHSYFQNTCYHLHVFIDNSHLCVRCEKNFVKESQFVVSDWNLVQRLVMTCEESADFKSGDELDKQVEKADNKKLKEVEMG